MALDPSDLKNAIYAKIQTEVAGVAPNAIGPAQLVIWNAIAKAIADAVVAHITSNAQVTVTTTCTAGPGSGSGTVA